jgi:hypothetical protein
MKFPMIVLFLGLATLAQSKETSVPPAGVPVGAVAVDGHTWRWVDKQGKPWLFRSTQFGIMRSEEPKVTVGKRPEGVPVEATPVADGVWRWIDPQQKVWLFRDTPSGLMKTEEPKSAAAAAAPKANSDGSDAALDLISVKEEGDSLHFSRPGPFGKYSWVKKKTQLDRDEAIVWDRARAKSSAAKKD